jgi:hypothetical protein
VEIVALIAVGLVQTFVLVPTFAWPYPSTAAAYRPDWAFSWLLEFAV